LLLYKKKQKKTVNWCFTKVFSIIFLLLFCFYTSSFGQDVTRFKKIPQKVIIIDPGHGGQDYGAVGSDGTKEKTVTLALANILGEKLSAHYKIIFTRTGDYSLNLLERTAIANSNKGDIFIGLHLGGSFLRRINGTFIFYHSNETSQSAHLSYLSNSLQYTMADDKEMIPWDDIQIKYKKKSQNLANLILENLVSDKKNNHGAVVESASLLVLTGANMPAVIIEPFYITNPSDEKEYTTQDNLSKCADKIANGIKQFFSEK